MGISPVLWYELLTTSRRGRYFAARMAYGLVLLLVVWIEYRNFHLRNAAFPMGIKALGQFAGMLFTTFAGLQGGALLLLIPALVAGVVADEAQRKTLHDLLASGLSSGSIVLGKLGARLLHAGVFVAIGLPVVALVGLFGVLDPWDVLYVYAGTGALVFCLGGLSVLVSVVSRRPRDAILSTYGLVAAWLIGPPMLGSILMYMVWPFSMLAEVNRVVLAGHPMMFWSRLSSMAWMRASDLEDHTRWMATFLKQQGNELFRDFLVMIALQATAGAVFLVLAIVLLRPVRGFGGWAWRPRLGRRPRRERALAARPPCDDRPMLWKEGRGSAGGGLAWMGSLPVVLVLGTLLGCFLYESAVPAAGELAQVLRGVPTTDKGRVELNGMLKSTGVWIFVLWGLAVASAGAVAVTSEREGDTWTSLAASLLTREEVVWGKVHGALWSARRLMLTLVVMGLVGVSCGAIYWPGAVASLVGLGVYGWFAASLGVFVSFVSRNSTRGLILTAVVLIALNLGGFLVMATLIGDGASIAWAFACIPYAEFAPMVTYGEVPELVSGKIVWESGMKGSGLDLIALVVISLTVHSLAALALTLASFRAFDRLVDRPRRATGRPAARRAAAPRGALGVS